MSSVLMMSLFCLVVMSVSVVFSADVTIRHLLCSVLMMSVCVVLQCPVLMVSVCVMLQCPVLMVSVSVVLQCPVLMVSVCVDSSSAQC